MKLSTSRYQAKDLIEQSGALAVGITRRPPRWKLAYPTVRVMELAPSSVLLAELRAGQIGDDEFDRRYLAHLDSLGVVQVGTLLATATGGEDAILLCYENVGQGERCHRRVLAQWWEDQAGETVPELGTSP
jgi:uncharacterized protein YeaO (DUF488 family)